METSTLKQIVNNDELSNGFLTCVKLKKGIGARKNETRLIDVVFVDDNTIICRTEGYSRTIKMANFNKYVEVL